MTLGSPWMLSLVVLPLLIVAYVGIVRRRSRRADRLASEGLCRPPRPGAASAAATCPVRAVRVGDRPRLRRLARPTMSFALPQREGTVILAFDVSNSMRADDLEPTRIQAAKAAATAFAERQPDDPDRGRRVQRQRGHGPPADRRDGGGRRGYPAPLAGRTSLGQAPFTSLSTIAGKLLQIDESAWRAKGGEVDIGFFGSSATSCSRTGRTRRAPTPCSSPSWRPGGRTRPHDRDRNPGRDGPGD